MTIQEKFELQTKNKVISILKLLIRKIESGEVSIVSRGFWPTLDKKLMFNFSVLSRDFEKNIKDFNKYL